jgi:hypothetical protein
MNKPLPKRMQWATSVLTFALVGCGPAAKMVEEQPRDLRVEIPAPDPAWMDFVTPEAVIQPGEDKMFCTILQNQNGLTSFSDVKGYQGKFGHHIILLAWASDENPVGSTFDCSKMTVGFQPLAVPLNNLTKGQATELPANLKMAIQMHYVNTSQTPILVRDVIRLKRFEHSEVTEWVSMMVTNTANFVVPPKASNFEQSFDCVLPQDIRVSLLGGHMHEWGTKFRFEHGTSTSSLKTIYSVDDWQAEYRDNPPISLFSDQPIQMRKGDVLRTTCTWNNTETHALEFPEEMCSAFTRVLGQKDPVVCNIPKQE